MSVASSRSAALAARGTALRAALAANRQLGDMLGWCSATVNEAFAAAKLLKLPADKVAEMEELRGRGNWERHAPLARPRSWASYPRRGV